MSAAPRGWSPESIAMHTAWAFELLDEHLRRKRQPVPAWVGPIVGLCRSWAGGAPPVEAVTPAPLLLTYAQAAHLLAVSERTVQRLVDGGDLEAVRIRSQVRIVPSVIDAYVDGLTAPALPADDRSRPEPTISHEDGGGGHGVPMPTTEDRNAEAA